MQHAQSRTGTALVRSGWTILGWLLVFVGVSPRMQAQPDSLLFQYTAINASQFPTIVSQVKVWDSNYNPVENLTETHFQVYENGVRQLPIQVKEFKKDSGGVSVVLVMDVSGSMDDELDDAKNAAITFVNLLGNLDQAALISFDKKVRLEVGFTQDKQQLIDVINGLDTGSGTAVYDGVMLALDMVENLPGRTAIIVLSDGRDHSSKATLQETLDRARRVGTPIYTIGLGLKKNKGRPELIAIADASGGIFYDSPTTRELEEIYRRLAFLITSAYYEISYTSSNCAEDSSRREVRIVVQANGLQAEGTRSYLAPGSRSLLALAADVRPEPGKTFRLLVRVPDVTGPLTNIMQLECEVRFDPTYLAVAEPRDQSIRPGGLWGAASEVDFSYQLDGSAGILRLRFQRRPSAGPISGRGILAEVQFQLQSDTPDETPLAFEIQLLQATNPGGCPVILATRDLTLRSNGMLVWPGDTNHNGTVELTDVLQLGLYWDIAGPPRPATSDPVAWRPQLAKRFVELEATYADADGNGVVSERDLFPIGLNWRKSTSNPDGATAAKSRGLLAGRFRLEQVPVSNDGAVESRLYFLPFAGTMPAGLSFRLHFDPKQIERLDVRPGSAWPGEPLVFKKIDRDKGVLAFAMVMPGGETASLAKDELVRWRQRAGRDGVAPKVVIRDIALVDARGRVYEFDAVEALDAELTEMPSQPQVLAAYPNPFNPATRVRYFLPEPGSVRITVVDGIGRQVHAEKHQQSSAGWYFFTWEARYQEPPASAGIYFIRFDIQTVNGKPFRFWQKVVLVK
ncbi:MAG: VWA domain-containing protein [candidate division KSB1 bacterium]|nr:VWA domain-containing protein [candidate division KSB1 bacterium]MDQ7065856.1 VWA domain-containing protein [candidate division KSB1 bacterium]